MTVDEKAVREVLGRLYAAWADNDADAFAALYTDDATVVMPGVLNQGRAKVREHMAAGFEGPLKGTRAVDEPLEIRIIDGSTAIVVSRAGILMAGERDLTAEHERLATWVLCQQDGQWLIAAYANAPAKV
jgi:uncharacterized protein (TIGR02246 family)